jgi:hypothetical protein
MVPKSAPPFCQGWIERAARGSDAALAPYPRIRELILPLLRLAESVHGAICSLSGLFAGSLHGRLTDVFGFRAPLALVADFLQLVVGQMFDPDKRIMRGADANEFVQLDLNGGTIAVLGILDQKHHQEGNDGRAGIDDELPRI